MSINGLGKLLGALDDKLRTAGISDETIAANRRDTLMSIATAMGVKVPPAPPRALKVVARA